MLKSKIKEEEGWAGRKYLGNTEQAVLEGREIWKFVLVWESLIFVHDKTFFRCGGLNPLPLYKFA